MARSAQQAAKTIIDADFDHVDILLHVEVNRETGIGRIGEGQALGAESIMVVFDQYGPILGEGPLQSAAGRPSQTRVACAGVARHESNSGTVEVVGLIFVVTPGEAAFAVDQETIPSVTDPACRAGKKVGARVQGERRGCAKWGLAGEKRIIGLAADVCPRKVAGKSDDPVGRELMVAANLAAADKAGA